MSRYLKADPGTVFRGKKVYSSAQNATFTFPSTASTAKVMVFGGGGNSCSAWLADPACCLFCCCNNSCFACAFVHSGAGGGYSEKTYYGVGAQTACIVVGAAEATSSFCISGAGTVSATGGTSAVVCIGGGCGQCRCTAYGVGSGGDINRCGSLGACRSTQYYCYYCAGCTFCVQISCGGFINLPGGAPGSSTINGVAPAQSSAQILCACCYMCNLNSGPYYSACSNRNWSFWIYCDLPAGYGACPVETDKYYGYDWDIAGGSRVLTSGNPVAATLTVASCINTCCCNCCCCYCNVNVITLPGCYSVGAQGGIAGSGGAGGLGGIGGGGGGITTGYCVKTLPTGISGGPGLIVLYY
jgi:hypothetical protein